MDGLYIYKHQRSACIGPGLKLYDWGALRKASAP